MLSNGKVLAKSVAGTQNPKNTARSVPILLAEEKLPGWIQIMGLWLEHGSQIFGAQVLEPHVGSLVPVGFEQE
jgi:hypothetical protein